ncbi:hypothetical protein [Halosimplex amylolyticum]|uniref:hypothetical protein n=1 Tax=Halosimplex amylolyticum TaxID=3396616 RepID=UPI003F579466
MAHRRELLGNGGIATVIRVFVFDGLLEGRLDDTVRRVWGDTQQFCGACFIEFESGMIEPQITQFRISP